MMYERHWCWLTVLAVGLLGLSGCSLRDEIEADIRENRQRSYDMLARATVDPNSDSELMQIDGELSLARALELAETHNKALQQARLRFDEAAGQKLEAASTALPKVALAGGAYANDHEFDSQKDSYSWSVSAEQPLYQGGLAGAALDAAATFSFQVEQELRQTRQQVYFAIRRAYLGALLAAELESVARQSKIDATENLRLVTSRYEQGAALRFEVLRARVRLRSIEADIIKTQNAYVVSVAELLDEIGIAQLSHVTLSEALEYLPIAVNKSACLLEAIQRRPDLLVGEALVRLRKNAILAEKTETRPKVFLRGIYQQDNPGLGDDGEGGRDWERTMSGGIAVEWAAFDGLRTEGRVRQATAQWHAAQVALRQQEEQVQFEVTEALLNLTSSKEFVLSQSGNVEDAQEALRLAQVNFREGAGTSLDVVAQESALAVARSDYISAVFDYEISKLQLNTAVGTLGERALPLAAENQ